MFLNVLDALSALSNYLMADYLRVKGVWSYNIGGMGGSAFSQVQYFENQRAYVKFLHIDISPSTPNYH